MDGPLAGIRVVELAHPHVEVTGKLLGCLGADVVVVERPDGAESRRRGPFVTAKSGAQASVSWSVNNVSKRSVVIDTVRPADRDLLAQLVASADVVLDGHDVDRHPFGLDRRSALANHAGLVWTSVTPYGVDDPRNAEPVTDLTLTAGGGLVWSCGYDDHALPPVRPGGDQSVQTSSVWAAIGTLTAIWHRMRTGDGQLVDVSMHAAVNITTEQASYEWLVAGTIVNRQTGRHAAVEPTQSPFAVGKDDRLVHTGVPPRSIREYQTLLTWLRELGAESEVSDLLFLEMGAETGVEYDAIGSDPIATAIYGAGREAMLVLAASQTGKDYFLGAQRRGLSAGIVYEPGEVLDDPHLVERAFAVTVDDPVIGPMRMPGPPFRSPASPWQVTRPAPGLGEHTAEVVASLAPAGSEA
jgi:crotonobetainyl-CoA:carnitine CoA-transferase CaiB-like acyl-CoA transferase